MPLTRISHDTNSSSEDDGRLVCEVLGKDRKATAEFVARCSDWVYPFVYRRLTPRTSAVEDLMQEVLLAAWQGLGNFRGEGGLRAWILGIARHKVEDYYRKHIREADCDPDEESALDSPVFPTIDRELDDIRQQERVEQTLAHLPEAYALALLWRYREEKSVREMAELTGKTEKAIERLLARARHKFKEKWNDDRLG